MLIAIDPGVQTLGYAIWNNAPGPKPTNPDVYGSYDITRMGLVWHDAIDYIISDLRIQVDLVTDDLIIELPTVMGGARGKATAEGGTVVKVAVCVGQLLSVVSYAHLQLITPSTWKGSLKDVVVNKRINRALPTGLVVVEHQHAMDAIGVGLFAQGFKLNNAKFFGGKK